MDNEDHEPAFPADAMALRDEIKGFLASAVADNGKPMDQGGGLGGADLWVWVGGREYIITAHPAGGEG